MADTIHAVLERIEAQQRRVPTTHSVFCKRSNGPDDLFLRERCRATVFVGGPHETITHNSFVGSADDCCRSDAHKSCSCLGLGLAWRRMGMGLGGAALGLAAGALIGSALAAPYCYVRTAMATRPTAMVTAIRVTAMAMGPMAELVSAMLSDSWPSHSDAWSGFRP